MRCVLGCVALVACFAAPAEARRPKPVTQVASPSFRALDKDGRADWLARARAIVPLPTRLKVISNPFLGTPYGPSPLGEGAGADPDPRLRYDLVDCLTFVETTMAMAVAPDDDALMPVLNDIRYGEGLDFEDRNHFAEAQWIPNNLRKGWIRDITSEVAGRELESVTMSYPRDRWRKGGRLEGVAIDAEHLPTGTFSIPVVPFRYALKNADRIPSGSIMFVVRAPHPTVPTRVTHVGFVFDSPGGKVLRHASKEPYHRVVDEPLSHFLTRNSAYLKWPVDGFSIYEVVLANPRLETMAGRAAR